MKDRFKDSFKGPKATVSFAHIRDGVVLGHTAVPIGGDGGNIDRKIDPSTVTTVIDHKRWQALQGLRSEMGLAADAIISPTGIPLSEYLDSSK